MSAFQAFLKPNERQVKVAVIGTDRMGSSVATVIELCASLEAIEAGEHHEMAKQMAANSGVLGPYLLFNEQSWPELMSLARMLRPATQTQAKVAA